MLVSSEMVLDFKSSIFMRVVFYGGLIVRLDINSYVAVFSRPVLF